MRGKRTAAALVALSLWLAACDGQEGAKVAPPPQEPTREAVGHYCGMTLVDHAGPKGQVFLESQAEPVWFTSARDTLAFTMLPEEAKDIRAIYVNDMGRAKSWDHPEPGAWVEARKAFYVIDSRRQGGMGAPEAVPFSTEAAARDFAGQNGGRVVAFADLPKDYILGDTGAPGPDGEPGSAPGTASPPGAAHGGGH